MECLLCKLGIDQHVLPRGNHERALKASMCQAAGSPAAPGAAATALEAREMHESGKTCTEGGLSKALLARGKGLTLAGPLLSGLHSVKSGSFFGTHEIPI